VPPGPVRAGSRALSAGATDCASAIGLIQFVIGESAANRRLWLDRAARQIALHTEFGWGLTHGGCGQNPMAVVAGVSVLGTVCADTLTNVVASLCSCGSKPLGVDGLLAELSARLKAGWPV
jgi:hypothetical protein